MAKLDKPDIKLLSGEFDSEIIKNLCLSNLNLECITFLADCTALRILDLSYNSISNLKPICSLFNLEILILNSNKIVNLRPLSSLLKLYKLELAGNCIASYEDLISLGSLFALKHLVLAICSKFLSNPVCDLPDYFSSVIDILPSLRFLDFVSTHSKSISLFNTVFQAPAAKPQQLSSSTLSEHILECEKTWNKKFSQLEEHFDSELRQVNNSINNRLVLLDAVMNNLKSI